MPNHTTKSEAELIEAVGKGFASVPVNTVHRRDPEKRKAAEQQAWLYLLDRDGNSDQSSVDLARDDIPQQAASMLRQSIRQQVRDYDNGRAISARISEAVPTELCTIPRPMESRKSRKTFERIAVISEAAAQLIDAQAPTNRGSAWMSVVREYAIRYAVECWGAGFLSWTQAESQVESAMTEAELQGLQA